MEGEPMAQKLIPPYMRVLGERVHLLRRRLRLSQLELAKRAGMSPTTLSNIEQAKMPTITVEHLVALGRVLNASPDCLLGVEPLPEGTVNEQESEFEPAAVA